MTDYSTSYYEKIRGELQATLFQISPNLTPGTYRFVVEMLDANELGVSLETMAETLAEVGLPITSDVLDSLSRLADEMKMDFDVKGLLANLVTE